MDLLRVILMVADPLMVGFIVSVFLGVAFKKSSGLLVMKRALVLLSAISYMLLYVYADSIWNNDIVRYIVMFAPIAIILLVIVISLIVAPKGQVEDGEMEKEHKTAKFFTGYDSMFPNDLDEYDKHKK